MLDYFYFALTNERDCKIFSPGVQNFRLKTELMVELKISDVKRVFYLSYSSLAVVVIH